MSLSVFDNNIQARIADLETVFLPFFYFISLLQASKKCLNIGKKAFILFCSFLNWLKKALRVERNSFSAANRRARVHDPTLG
jgi:hypothetical protein